jgi:predicted Rossmann fold nucleotide-binding protein DprA/Smf involved in DNA uptake
MDIQDYLSDDGQAVLALCSAFGLPEDPSARKASPFKLSEWNELERQTQNSGIKQPSALQGRSASQLEKELGISEEDSERIVALLDRSSRLALEVENLFSRGMWVVTRADERYPARLRDTLKHQAPSVLFGAGETRLLTRPGIAVVGSRNIDEAGAAFAKEVGAKTVSAGLPVVSGGARGTDRLAMDGALQADGCALGALADSLEATIRKPDVREYVLDGRLLLLSPYVPSAGFSVGGAMGRNKLIYGLSEFAVVVSSDYQTGGTWAGAVEALKAGWCPVFVREFENAPKGNREMVKQGANALPEATLAQVEDLAEWLRAHAKKPASEELDLFG